MEAIPAHTKELLVELATAPTAFDPARLLFRTTLDALETYHDGKIKRLMLNLTAEQRTFVALRIEGSALLRGCAGSGKTTIAIHRAVEAALAGQRVLFLTFNRALATAIRDLIAELVSPLPETLEVTNIDAWATSYLEAQGQALQFLTADDTKTIYACIVDEQKQQEAPPSPFLQSQWWGFYREEIERVIKANGLATLQDYLTVDRIGRGHALQSAERRYVWAVFERYQTTLAAKGYNDWQDVPIVTLRDLTSTPEICAEIQYDQIIVDEAQDMRLTQVQLINAIAKPDAQGRRSIFMVGDSSQTLYTRGFTWLQAGLDIRGHSFRIRHNMRSSRQIANAAARLSEQNHIFGSPAEIIDPQRCTRDGAKPIWLQPATNQQEPHEVVNKIFDLLGGTDKSADHALFRLSDFAILCPNHQLVEEYVTALALKNIPCSTAKGDKPFEILENTVKVLTIHAAKGLEFPVGFIVGLHQGTLPRVIRTKIAEEYALELERNRILLYVAMTRAVEGLYLVASLDKLSQFLDEIGEDLLVVERIP
ncbi:MAG: UvrD-helicase domain-containing protein [Anaerolineae bacterium]|nr:UvrD-helicase domain-containing protein [Anaerolineae bacterium]